MFTAKCNESQVDVDECEVLWKNFRAYEQKLDQAIGWVKLHIKFKKRIVRRRVKHWLGEVAKHDRDMFAHWKAGNKNKGRS